MDVVIGAGMGGLTAATALARSGREVVLVESRGGPGGLASGFDVNGRSHDGGPYILLDLPGLRWAFERLGLVLEEHIEPIPLDEVFRVDRPDGPTVTIWRDVERTADALSAIDRDAPDRYRAFVKRMGEVYDRLTPLQRAPRPGPIALVRRGLLREAAFLLRGLADHLADSGLPRPVTDALGIWTHIAGQPLAEAPAPLAFVPAVIHHHGAWTVKGGIRRVPEALAAVAERVGVDIRYGATVRRILRSGTSATGVELTDGSTLHADRVFSNAPGIATHARLLDPPDAALSRTLEELPLQSPGVAAYLEADAAPTVPFLRFLLPREGGCRLLVRASAVDPTRPGTARLLSPTPHGRSEADQKAFLDRVLAEPWWREGLTNVEVVATRVPRAWGEEFHLWRESMNPVMTAAFMRHGRIPHRSPVCQNLFLCGSATHPGQWVSFCAISGLLAVEEASS